MKRLLHAAVVLLFSASWAHAQPPTVSHVVPLGLKPGESTDIVLHGGQLAGANHLWTGVPSTAVLTPGVEKNGTEAGHVSYRVALPPETPLGVMGVRVATGQGVSNLRLVLVDDLPTVVEAGDNHARGTAFPIAFPIAVEGACEAEASDFFKLTVAAGQRLSFDVFARRLGSPLDPVIRLLSADGHELAFSDDEPSTGADGRFSYTFANAGDYFVEIRDIRFQGGGAHRYRLRIGDFPLPTVAYPVAVQKGATASVQWVGKNVAASEPRPVAMPAQAAGDRLNVAANYAAGQGSSWVTLVASDVADQLEHEPNNAPEQSTAVQLPGVIEGRFENRGDRDFFQFNASKGQRWVFTGQTRSLGSPCDLFMRLYNAEGGVVAEAEDAGTDEGSLNFTFPADGIYRLRVEDTSHRGGADEVYRITVEPYQPGFSLAAAVEKVDAPQNGVFVVKVTAVRRDYNGPITLSVEGAGEGSTVRHNVIPEGKAETTMHVTLGPSLTAGQNTTVRILGHAKIGEADFRATASTLVAMRTGLSGLPFPPAALDGNLALGVGPIFPEYYQLAAATPVVPLVQANTASSLKVQLTRAHGFDDKVDLSVDGLPSGVTAKVAAIDKGKAEAVLEFTSPTAIAPGKHPFRVLGNASFQNQPRQVIVNSVALEGPPVAISFAASGPVTAGGKQKGQLTFAGEVSPVSPAATYLGGVTRGAEGPRAPALPGYGADNRGVAFSGLDKAPGDDRLTADLPVSATGDYSVELWFYNTRDLTLPNSPAISGYFYSRAGVASPGNAQPGDHLGIGGVESSPRDRLFYYNGQSLAAGRTQLAINTWHHVALVRSGDEVRVYLNGDPNPEIQFQAPKSVASRQICLGTRADGFAPFQGRLDEVAVFDTPLTAAQVQSHVAAAKAEAPARDVVLKDAPIAYWGLDETEGNLAASMAPAHKRAVRLAWKNLPGGVTAPEEVILVDGQKQIEIELSAAATTAPGKVEQVIVAATTAAGTGEFTADSAPGAIEVTKP